ATFGSVSWFRPSSAIARPRFFCREPLAACRAAFTSETPFDHADGQKKIVSATTTTATAAPARPPQAIFIVPHKINKKYGLIVTLKPRTTQPKKQMHTAFRARSRRGLRA